MARAGAWLGAVVFGSTGLLGSVAMAADPTSPGVRTNIEGIYASPAPNGPFDPVAASDAALAAYGFPPRPDAAKAPDAYAEWIRSVSPSIRRLAHPLLMRTSVRHGPMKALSLLDTTVTPLLATSTNWSGYAVLNGLGTFNSPTSFVRIAANWVIPIAAQAFGACTGGWVYTATWVGIDGFNSPDVLQAGTAADANCSAGVTTTQYYPWFEWYPNYEYDITNLAINPGNDVLAAVWATSTTQGHAYIVNYSLNQAVSVTFSAPSGTVLVGNSAEWILEAPTVNGGQSALANYVQDFMVAARALDGNGNLYHPAVPGTGNNAYGITMVDGNGDAISTVRLLGPGGMMFSAVGSAF